jgi:hypothetical protein
MEAAQFSCFRKGRGETFRWRCSLPFRPLRSLNAVLLARSWRDDRTHRIVHRADHPPVFGPSLAPDDVVARALRTDDR